MQPEHVVLVDSNGQPTGRKEKLAAHRDGDLHLAFSVMVTRRTEQGLELLLQRRADEKYHSAGLWTNTCCSHPRVNESLKVAALRRLQEELGVQGNFELIELGSFIYKASLEHSMIEHELDHVFLIEDQVHHFTPNPAEIKECLWWPLSSIDETLSKSPYEFTAWFQHVYQKVMGHYEQHVFDERQNSQPRSYAEPLAQISQ